MPTIKVMSAGAVQAMVEAIGKEFERLSGHRLDLNFGTAGALRERFAGGRRRSPDPAGGDHRRARTKTAAWRRADPDLGRTVTGVAVRAGAPVPDISTPEAFKRALITAKTVSYTDPKAGGSSGTFFAALLERLGIAEAVNKKAVLGKRGYEVAQAVADGRAEIGTTFISEILTVPGARVIGPLPGDLHNSNTYTAAIPKSAAAPERGQALLQALSDPATRARWTRGWARAGVSVMRPPQGWRTLNRTRPLPS